MREEGLDLVGIPAPSSRCGVFEKMVKWMSIENKTNIQFTLPTPSPSLFTPNFAPILIAADFSLHEAFHAPWPFQGLDYVKPDQLTVGESTEETTQ